MWLGFFINFPFSLSFTVRRSAAGLLANSKTLESCVPTKKLPKELLSLQGKFEKAVLEAEILVHLRRVDGAFTLCLIEPTHCSIAEDTAYGRK